MKNKILAVFGIGTYVLSIIASASDLQGNPVMPVALIILSVIATAVFIVMATIWLWKKAKNVSILLLFSSVILFILMVIQQFVLPNESSIILLLNLVKIINFIAFIWAIITLFKINDFNILDQQKMAEELYEKDPNLAMRIAKGEEKAPEGIRSSAIYAKVCSEAEKSEDIDMMMQIANSLDNFEISSEAKKLKLRDPWSAIEKMKEVVNARRKAFEKTLPAGETLKSTEKKIAKELEADMIFLENYIIALLNCQEEIDKKINKIKIKTKQYLDEEKLKKELWVLRYAFLHLWFFNMKPPKNQNELEVGMSLINHAFQDIKATSDYLPWLTKGFIEYSGTDQLKFSNLEELKTNITEKGLEKIPLIAFECTKGRLGGELHDFVIELIMTVIMQDKRIFETGDIGVTTMEEIENINSTLEELKLSREQAGKEFFEDLLSEDSLDNEMK